MLTCYSCVFIAILRSLASHLRDISFALLCLGAGTEFVVLALSFIANFLLLAIR